MSRIPRLAVSILVLASVTASEPATGASAAEPDYGGEDEAWISDVGSGPARYLSVDPAGNTYVVAGAYDEPLRLSSLARDGSLRWEISTGTRNVHGMVIAPDGSSITVVMTKYRPDGRFLITRSYLASSGELRWTRSVRLGQMDAATGIALSPGGDRVYVAGFTFSLNVRYPFVVARAIDDGGSLWAWHGERYLRPLDVEVRPGGRVVYVTGEGDRGAAVVALTSANGSVRWRHKIATTEVGDMGIAIAVDPSGQRVYVAAADREEDYLNEWWEDEIVVSAFRADDGLPLWRHRVIGTNDLSTWPNGLVAIDDSVIVAGVATLVPSCAGSEDCLPEDSDMLTIALSVWHGLTRWRDRYDGAHDAGYTSLDGARGVVVGGEHVYVSGYERWDGGSIATTIAYTKSGGVRDWIGRCGALTPEFGAIGYSNEVTPRVMVGGTDGASEAIAIAYPA